MRATKRLTLIPHFFGIINIREHFVLRPSQYTPPRSHFALSPYQLISESFVMPSYYHTSIKALLESSPLPEGLANDLGNAWTVPVPRGRFPKARPATGDPTGAKLESGEPLIRLVTSLVVRQVPGSEVIFLLGVRENAKIVLVHSLFTVSPDIYSANVQLLGVVGDLSKDGTPSLLLLTGIKFSPNFYF